MKGICVIVSLTWVYLLTFIVEAAVNFRYGLRQDRDKKWRAFFEQRNYKILCSQARDHHWANCQKFQERGMCKSHWYNMEMYCPKTCKFCLEDRAQAPVRCEATLYGCCKDRKTLAKGKDGFGCPETCFDTTDFDCPHHAKKGYCYTHYQSMRKRCPKSCNYCSKGNRETCMDFWRTETCKMLARFGTCKSWKNRMSKYCPKTCRICTAAAPELKSVASDCSMSGEGCCWDRHTPLSKGCPDCRDMYGSMFCERFKMECRRIERVNGLQVRIFCPKSCGLCKTHKCQDDVTLGVFCEEWKARGHCRTDPLPMGVYCRQTCRFCR